MKIINQIAGLLEQASEAWQNEVSQLEAANAALQTKVYELEEAAVAFDDATRAMSDAIYEGRRQDAIDILNEVTGEQFRSVAEQHNLFPARVPA